MRQRFLFFLLLLVGSPLGALADEVRIVDALGLTRAVRPASSAVTVAAEFGKALKSQSVSLVHVDGVGGDIPGEPQTATRFLFSNVTSGTWRITLTPAKPPVKVVSVRVR